MLKLGSRQLQILKRCERNGHVSVFDVYPIYNISDNSRGIGSSNSKYRRGLAILEKLELFGLLDPQTVSDWPIKRIHWHLTEKGKDVLKENLEAIK